MKCIFRDDERKYRIYQSDVILNNHQQMVDEVYAAYERFGKFKDIKDMNTLPYSNHKDDEGNNMFVSGVSNAFAFAAPSALFYDLYMELRDIIREYISFHVGDSERLYLDTWLNYCPYEISKMPWHDHAFSYHGYIALDPQKSITDFGDWQIPNEIGYIYIGPGYQHHRVVVLEEHDKPRLTIGYDVEYKSVVPDSAPAAFTPEQQAGYTMNPLH